jgi:hypothetical protein
MRRRRRKLLRCSSVLDGDGSDPLNKQASKLQSMERMEVSFGILIHHQRKLYSSRLERERERC